MRLRLAAAFVAVALGAVALLASLTLQGARSEVSGLVERQRTEAVQEVAAAVTDAYAAAGSWDAADLRPAVVLARSSGAALEVRDSNGTLLAGPGSGLGAAMEAVMGAGSGAHGGRAHDRGPLGPARRAPIIDAGSRVGTATLRFAASQLPAPERQVRDALVRRVLIGSAVAVLLAVLVAALVSRWITSPLTRLRTVVGRMRAGDRGARANMDGAPGEIGELAAAFDQMGDALVREDELRRTLIADVAHELRTPLTVLQGHCEAFLDGVEPVTIEQLGSMRDELLRLGRVIEDVEALAAAEAAGLGLRRAPTDLAQVAAEAAHLLSLHFQTGEVELRTQLEPAIVDGDADRLMQVVTNLLTNALKYTPAGGHATLRVAADDGHAVLTVADSGPGIPADELPHIFTRFWRGSSAAATSGSGIGLAVVDELVRAHGGTVEAASPPGGGTTFTVRLPLRRA